MRCKHGKENWEWPVNDLNRKQMRESKTSKLCGSSNQKTKDRRGRVGWNYSNKSTITENYCKIKRKLQHLNSNKNKIQSHTQQTSPIADDAFRFPEQARRRNACLKSDGDIQPCSLDGNILLSDPKDPLSYFGEVKNFISGSSFDRTLLQSGPGVNISHQTNSRLWSWGQWRSGRSSWKRSQSSSCLPGALELRLPAFILLLLLTQLPGAPGGGAVVTTGGVGAARAGA